MPPFERQWEARDFRVRAVLGAGAALVLGLVMVGGLILSLESWWLGPRGDRAAAALPGRSPLGEAEFEAGQDRERLEAEARRRLGAYGWVDRAAGVAHIPLARALELEVQRARKQEPESTP